MYMQQRGLNKRSVDCLHEKGCLVDINLTLKNCKESLEFKMGCGSSRAVVAVEPCKVDINGNQKIDKGLKENEAQNSKLIDAQITRLGSAKVQKSGSKSSGTAQFNNRVDPKVHGSTGNLTGASKDLAEKPARSVSSASLHKTRNSSASSRRTCDSGVYDSEKASMLDERVITEESSASLKGPVEMKSRPATPDLSIDGQKIAERGSAKARHRQALLESRKASAPNLKSLEEAPLVRPLERPESVAFDIMLCPDVGNVKKKPERLAKLQQQSNARRKRKSKKAATKTDIEQKLRDAEERRKNLEHERQAKARISQRVAHSETPVMELEDSDEDLDRVQDIL